MLVPPQAPFLKGADLLIAADCVPFAYADFHEEFFTGKVLLVGCPKLDDAQQYREKLTEMFRGNDVASVTVAHMEVPCCFGMVKLVESAIGTREKNSVRDARSEREGRADGMVLILPPGPGYRLRSHHPYQPR